MIRITTEQEVGTAHAQQQKQTRVPPQFATNVRKQAPERRSVLWDERFTLARVHKDSALMLQGRGRKEEGKEDVWRGGLLLVTLHEWRGVGRPDSVVG